MKAIVHIGTEKTGTTSIQRYLHHNRKELRNAGFHLIKCAGKINHRALPVYCLSDFRNDDFYFDNGLLTLEQRSAFKADFIKTFESELAALPANIHTVLISSEHFHSRIRSDEEMDNVHRLLTHYFDEIRIVCYLREQVATCTSFYSTSLKSGGTETFSEFMLRCNPQSHYFNYQRMLENWGQRFGFEALDVALFDRAHFLNGDLLDDFTARIDGKLVGRLRKETEVENESLAPAGQILLLAVNRGFSIREIAPPLKAVRRICEEIIYQRHRGKGQQPPPDAVAATVEAFDDCNEWVRKTFFPELPRLFVPFVNTRSNSITKSNVLSPDVDVESFQFDEAFLRTLMDVLEVVKKKARPHMEATEYANACTRMLYSVGESILIDGPAPELQQSMLMGETEAKLFRRAGLKLQHHDVESALHLLRLAAEVQPGLRRVKTKIDELEERLKTPSDRCEFFLAYYVTGTLDESQREPLIRDLLFWIASLDTARGTPLVSFPAHRRVAADGVQFPSGDSPVGYTLIWAESIDAAEAIARTCPALDAGVSIEVSLMKPLVNR